VGALKQIREQAQPGELGLVVLHESGARDSLVVLSLADFRERWGGDLAEVATGINGEETAAGPL